MKKFNELNEVEQRRVRLEWLNCEGYDDYGNDYDSPEEYWEGINKPHRETREPRWPGDEYGDS